MSSTRISLIAAVASNGVIGDRGRIPWRLSEDLRRFRRLTMGHVLVMGRRTYESIGKALPGRRTIVLTRTGSVAPPVEIASSVDAALLSATSAPEIFVAGGEEIYRAFLPRADRLLLTWVEASPAGDACWPDTPWERFRVVEESRHPADERNQFASRYVVYERIDSAS